MNEQNGKLEPERTEGLHFFLFSNIERKSAQCDFIWIHRYLYLKVSTFLHRH